MRGNIESNTQSGVGAIFAIYLLGLLLDGLYVGMISPVRLVIQQDFGLGDTAGIWMVNIYTLFYAACIPVIGKLADIRGRKPVFIGCLLVFMAGSLICGLSQILSSFPVLLAGRLVQAVGACGIIPVANAEIGATFPQEKKGMALGIAAAVAGIANVIGAAVGSLVVGIVGNDHWSALFFFAIPVCLALIVASLRALPNHNVEDSTPLDIPGSVLLVVTVLLFLFAVQHIDVRHVDQSLASAEVLAPALGFVASLAAFVLMERRAESPVFHLEYLGNKPIVITMMVSFFVGCVIITMTIIPEVAEFIMSAPVGSGGLYILPVGIVSMFGPPIGGKLIDKFGPKPVMMGGLSVAAAGFLFLAFVSLNSASAILLIVGLSIMGLGMGFAMGAPPTTWCSKTRAPQKAEPQSQPLRWFAKWAPPWHQRCCSVLFLPRRAHRASSTCCYARRRSALFPSCAWRFTARNKEEATNAWASPKRRRLACFPISLARFGECALTWERHRARFKRFCDITCPIRHTQAAQLAGSARVTRAAQPG